MRSAARRLSRSEQVPSSEDTIEQVAIVAKALGHPARLNIVRLLLEKQSCIGCDFVDQMDLAQSTVSEHLRILKAAGIITGEIERPRVCYSLNRNALQQLQSFLAAATQSRKSSSLARK